MGFMQNWLKFGKGNNTSKIFDDIEGHDDAKKVLLWALESEKPVHILLKGPYGIGKTELLKRVYQYVGERNSHWAIGSRTSKAGLSDLFITNKNLEWVFIDEFESLPRKDQYVLLSATEDGHISETLFGKTKDRNAHTKVRVFATTNETRKLDRALLTRFVVVDMKGYTEDEFVKVAFKKAETEGVEMDTIEFIARNVYREFYQPDARDVVQIARLSKGDEERILTLIEMLKVKKQIIKDKDDEASKRRGR